MGDEFNDYARGWGFEPSELPDLAQLAACYGADLSQGALLIDSLFTRYKRAELVRAALRSALQFRGRTFNLLHVSPHALEAAVRLVVRAKGRRVDVRERQRILNRYLASWGLGDQAAQERAEEQLLRIAGPGVSDDELSANFMAARAAYQAALRERVEAAEARDWLAGNPTKTGFAGNRFSKPGLAERFVEALYAAGATAVTIHNISYDHETREGGPMADSMTVGLPDEDERRAAVFEVINTIGQPDGAPLSDEEEGTIELWWD